MKIDRRTVVAGAAALGAASLVPGALRAEPALRVASLKFGSLSWLLDTIVAEKIDKAVGLNLQIVDTATSMAGPIALMSADADVIVSDWPWAIRQRSKGEPLKFSPYSSALGSVMVAGDGDIKTLADLKGKRLGVAGGSIDKSWILLRAYSRKTLGEDIADLVTPVYGAPPLLSEEMRQGRIDAVLNFWTFSARLRGLGYRPLVSLDDVLAELGVKPVPPLVGFIWNAERLTKKPGQIEAFFKAVAKGNEVLANSDEAWLRLKDSMRVESDGEFVALRDYYRSGIPEKWSKAHTDAAEKLLALLIELGQKDLVGTDTKFDAGLFHGS